MWSVSYTHLDVYKRQVQGFSLTTQMYVAGEPLNNSDFLLSRIRDPEKRARVIVPLEPSQPDAGAGRGLIGIFDIVLGA